MYDENEAVDAINKALKNSGRQPYANDELLNVIDMIWDYYEENGMLEIDDDEEVDEDIASDLADYIRRMLKKDKQSNVDFNDIDTIVKAELDYEDDTALDL